MLKKVLDYIMLEIDSSFIEEIGCINEDLIVKIGKIYYVYGGAGFRYADFKKAKSKGAYYGTYIRGQFNCFQLEL